jgi:hypothetical protein
MSEVADQEGENAATLTRYCRRCRRKLRSERSMKLGLGPICIMKEAEA